MSFLKSLKIWDTDIIVESTLKHVSKAYSRNKKKYVDCDCHFWLAAVFMNRSGYYSGLKSELTTPFSKTLLFSVLDEDRAIFGLGYFFLSQEMPHAISKLESQYRDAMRPADDLIAQSNFFQKWETTNPWTVNNIVGIREAVYHATHLIANQSE